MNLILRNEYDNVKEYCNLEQYAENKLDGSDYGQGALEDAARTADNVVSAFGRLLDVLATKGFLDAGEVVEVVEGYNRGSATFMEEPTDAST